MTWVPRFKLYDSDSITLLYTFEAVQRTNSPQTPLRHIPIEGVRGKGKLIIPAGTENWDLEIEGVMYIDTAVEDYQDLITKIDAMESAIELNTAYYLRIDKTESTYYEYKIKRVEAIEYPESLRTDMQRYTAKFIVNAW